MTKTHFTLSNATAVATMSAVCGRTAKRATENVHQVTCLSCKDQPEFKDAVVESGLRAAEAFANQTPATVRSPWNQEPITCKCGHNLFRSNGRSLDYFDYVCAACGTTTQVLTETGMSR
jgi:hypothetical protein